MLRDMLFRTGRVQLLAPADTVGVAVKSLILDVSNAARAAVLISSGVMTGVDASNYLTPVLEESDTTNDVDFTAVNVTTPPALDAGDEIPNTGATALVAANVVMLGYLGTKRYIRVNNKLTGSTVSHSVIGVIGILEPFMLPPQSVMPLAIVAT